MPRNNTWTNSDGLVVGFGTRTDDSGTPAIVSSSGIEVIKTTIIGTEVPDTASATNGIATPQAYVIHRGSIIVRALLEVHEAFTSGGSATLDIGLWTRGLATDVVDDANGIQAGTTVAELTTIGEINVCDGALLPIVDGVATGVVGRTGLGDCVITAEYATAAFTAGKAILTVEFIRPSGSAGRTIAAV